MSIDINALQNGILTGVAVVGAVVAVIGLSTWKKQLRGTHEFELARRLLFAVYKIQDGVRSIRRPFLEPREADDPKSDEWQTSAYQNRWNPVSEAFRELRVAALEAEIMWGRDILKTQNEALAQHINQLWYATENMLSDKQKGSEELFTDEDFKVLYSRPDDAYEKRLVEIVGGFDEVIRPKLSR